MTQTEALTLALTLALTAPTEEQSKQASDLAEHIAVGMSELEVQRCKKAALKASEGK